MKKLRDVEAPVANFFASGVLCLRKKLGPILWQFPPNMRFDEEKFRRFFEMLPRDTKAAADVAKGHDERMKGRNWTKAEVDLPIRYAVEIRHESFKTPAFVDLLREYDVALVFADTAGKWPYFEDVTSDFIYARLHGDKELYVSGYTDSALDWWAARLCAWRDGKEPPDAKRVSSKATPRAKRRDVYVYFDNDVKVRSPFDAINLAARMSGTLDACVAAPDLRKLHELPRTRWPGFRRARPATAARGRQ